MKVYKNKSLWRIFGPKRQEATTNLRKQHSKELHDFYSSSSIIRMIKARKMRGVGYVAHMGNKRNASKILTGKPEGKSPLRRWRY
jgi:hypothetical protein